MTETLRAILLALRHYGRTKPFIEILDEIGIPKDNSIRLEVTNALEAGGFIHNVQYQLPLSINAEISPTGLEAVIKEDFDENRKKSPPIFVL